MKQRKRRKNRWKYKNLSTQLFLAQLLYIINLPITYLIQKVWSINVFWKKNYKQLIQHNLFCTNFKHENLFGLFAGWFLGWFGLAGAGLLWEKNTVDWLIRSGCEQAEGDKHQRPKDRNTQRNTHICSINTDPAVVWRSTKFGGSNLRFRCVPRQLGGQLHERRYILDGCLRLLGVCRYYIFIYSFP